MLTEALRFVSSEGFAIAFGVFVCVGLWRGCGFIGRRFFGETGYLTQYVNSVKESHTALSDSHKQTALAVIAMQQGVAAMQKTMEHESDRRSDVDEKVIKVLNLVADGSLCHASHLIQLQKESDPRHVESKSESGSKA